LSTPFTLAYTPLVPTFVVVVSGSVYSHTGEDCPRVATVELVALILGNAGNSLKVAARLLGSGTVLPTAATVTRGDAADVVSRV
jgi:hypothetical protein